MDEIEYQGTKVDGEDDDYVEEPKKETNILEEEVSDEKPGFMARMKNKYDEYKESKLQREEEKLNRMEDEAAKKSMIIERKQKIRDRQQELSAKNRTRRANTPMGKTISNIKNTIVKELNKPKPKNNNSNNPLMNMGGMQMRNPDNYARPKNNNSNNPLMNMGGMQMRNPDNYARPKKGNNYNPLNEFSRKSSPLMNGGGLNDFGGSLFGGNALNEFSRKPNKSKKNKQKHHIQQMNARW